MARRAYQAALACIMAAWRGEAYSVIESSWQQYHNKMWRSVA